MMTTDNTDNAQDELYYVNTNNRLSLKSTQCVQKNIIAIKNISSKKIISLISL